MRYLGSSLITACAVVWSAPAAAQITITANFSRGAIAEYTNNPNGTDNGVLFSSLGISNMSISQLSGNGSWGGTQGNDTAVTARITFTSGRVETFPAAINWVKNAGGGQFDWVGITIRAVTVNDGYNLTPGKSKTYVLQFSQSSLNLATLLPNGLDGSANTGAALKALNQYFPTAVATPPVITGPSGGAGSATSALSVNENQTAVTSLTASKPVSWSITGRSDAGKFSVSPSGVVTFNAAPDFEVPTDSDANNTYILTVTATDSNGGTSTQTITVSVLNVDDSAPAVPAGQLFSYSENQSANAMIGKVAASDNIGVTGFRFAVGGAQTSSDGYYTIDNAGVVRITAAGAAAGVANNDFEITPNSFAYGVQASDAGGNWSPSTDITLNVADLDDTAPVVATGQSFSYAENQTANAIIGAVSASDVIGVTGFRFGATGTQTSSDGYYTIDNGGTIRITSAGVAVGVANNDFEISPNSFDYDIQASDAAGNWSPPTSVNLRETDVVEVPVVVPTPPVITGPGGSPGASSSAISVNENQTAVTTLTANEPVTWAIIGGTDAAKFSISSSGVITFNVAPDFEVPTDSNANNSYVLTVEATDADGTKSSQTITVNVLDLDDTAPVVTAGQSFSYAENQAANAAVGTVAASDAGGVTGFRFTSGTQTSADGYYTIDNAGVIRITSAGVAAGVAQNDFETAPNSFTYSVQARDAAGNWSAPTDVVLNVTDLNDVAPVITGPGGSAGSSSGALSVNENQTAVTTLAANKPVIWTITGGSDAGKFQVNSSGVVTFVTAPDFEAPTDSDTNNSYVVTVTATDANGNASAQTITVTVLDLDDTAPLVPAGQSFLYAENQVANATVGSVSSSDAVGVTGFRFAGSGTSTSADGYYTIDSAGVIKITAAGASAGIAQNDFEITPNSFSYDVEARDGVGNWSPPTPVALNVTDVNDTAPVITGPSGSAGASSSSVSVNENQTAVTTLTSNKPVTWTVSGGTEAAKLSISPGGVITFNVAPDFEVPTDSDGNNTYLLTVTGTDANGNAASQTITVNVQDLDDTAPAVTAGQSFSYTENQTANAAVGTVAASDGVGVTGFRFTSGTQTSADGYYTIDNGGVVRITSAGVAAGVAQNDFETAPNSFTYSIQARDAAGNFSAPTDVVFNVTDLNDTAPVITGPGGTAGASSSSVSVNENQTAVTTLTSNKPVTWTITGGVDAAKFSISPSGVITFNAAPDFEVPTDSDGNNSYLLTVTGTDANGNAASQSITVNVLDLDDTAPLIAAGQSFSYAENQPANAVVGTVLASDAVGVIGFRFTSGGQTSADGYYTIDNGGVIRITSAGTAAGVAQNDFETAPNSFTYSVQASDAAGNWSAPANLALNVTDVNDSAPVITGPGGSAGASSSAISVNENQTAVTTLMSNKPVTWVISGGTDASKFSISPSGVITFNVAPDFETPTDSDTNNSYVVTVTGRDANGNAASQTITVSVIDLDDTAPMVPAGQSFSYAENQVANSTVGSVSASDAVGVTGFRFSASGAATSADGYYTIDSAGVIKITAAGASAGVAQNDFEIAPNSFSYDIEVRDAAGNWSLPAAIVLNVTDLNDVAPVITGPGGRAGSSSSAISVNENQTAVTTLTANKPVTWAISGGIDAAKFQVSPSGVVTFVAAPDFEAPTDSDANNSYVVTLTATDANGNASAQTITVTVLDLDDTSPVVPAGQSLSYAENRSANSVVGTVVASDAVGVSGFRFSASGTQTSSEGYYTIDNGGVVRITAAGTAAGVAQNDFETAPNSFSYDVQARDAAGNWSAPTAIVLNVTDVNDTAPVITGPGGTAGASSSALSVNENQTAVTTLTASKPVTWAITGGTDGGKFQISSSGVVTFLTAPDFEVPTDSDTNNSYVVTVTATDANGNSSAQTITVTVFDLDDTAPVVPAGQSFSYAENRSANSVVGTVAASDAVGVTGFRFSASGTQTTSDGYYTIDNGGVVRITAAGTAAGVAQNDFETAPNSFSYDVEARDGVGNWSSPTSIALNVTDLNDSAPVITGPGGSTGPNSSISVPEGTTSVTTLTSNTPISSWKIVGGNDQGRFTISPSGEMKFVASPDFEAPIDSDGNNVYIMTVEATDANGNVSRQTVTVNVTDIADTPPVITGPGGSNGATSTVSVPEGSTAVTTLMSNVPVTWTITGGNDQGRFTVSPSGEIKFVASPDFEAPADSDGNNSYLLTVTATDANGNTSQQTVTVNVTDRADTPPVITGPGGSSGPNSSVSVPEGLTSVATLTSNVPISSWKIVGGNDQGRFSVSPSGVITFVAAPDFEAPVDSDGNNVYILTVEATDANGNVALQTITVNVTDVADTPPVISGPGGSNGATSSVTVNEGTTAVTTLTSNVPVSWTITGGNDRGQFRISPSGEITFVASPDFEAPADSDGNNSYLLTVTATDANGQTSTQTITVKVADLPDSPPVITGPGGSTGGTSSVSVPEGSSTVANLTSNVPVRSWAIVGGNDRGRFAISPSGQVTFVSAPDFERPSDSDANNVYVLTVEVTDMNGNVSQQTITVNVTDLADTPPVITGPDGSTGTASTVSVPEGTTTVTTLTANVPISNWSIVGGNDQGRFMVSPSGVISFVAAPDFEAPVDSDGNNVYVISVQATDANGNASVQTVTVIVRNVADTPPAISGPSGAAGAAASAITVEEGTTAVTTLTASVPVTWDISGGNDRGQFVISPAGVLTFVAAPNFERPADSDVNNTYVLTIRATAADGSVSVQTITVTVINVEELKAKLGVIDSNLRSDLRNSAFSSLSTMLAFNEGLLGVNQSPCADAYRRPVTGSLNGTEDRQDASLNFRRDLSSCEGRTRVFVGGGVGLTRVEKNVTTRGLAALRVEHMVSKDVVLGAALVGSTASDDLGSFKNSHIRDKSLQLNVYGRARLTKDLRFAAFAGWGRSWYSFRLEDDGLSLRGDMDGKRHMYGAALSGDIKVGSLTVTTDAILSRAVENLGSADLDASYLEESGSNIGLRLGRVDVTRLSVPVHIPIVFGAQRDGFKQTRLEFSPGLLCQDTSADSSSIKCGYQLGFKFRAYPSLYSVVQAEARREVVDGYTSNLFSIGVERRFGPKRLLTLGMGLERHERLDQPDNRAMLRLSVGR